MVSLRLSGSSHFSVIRDVAISALPRACPIDMESDRIDLVTNGPVVYSYSPAHDHYWFSSVPNEEWFSEYYRTQWGRIGLAPPQVGLRAIVKENLGPPQPLVRRIVALVLGRTVNAQRDWVERFTLADMQRSFAMFAPQLPPGGCVIEVGTGAGDFLLPFIKSGYRARGFEPSPDSAARARAAGVDIIGNFAVDDEPTRQALSTADMVVSNHSLEHHYDPNRLLSLCARYMKPGAVLGITVPNAESEFLLMTHLFMLHLDSYTPVSLERMLNKHGFRVIDREIGGQLRFARCATRPCHYPPPCRHETPMTSGPRITRASCRNCRRTGLSALKAHDLSGASTTNFASKVTTAPAPSSWSDPRMAAR